MPRPAREPGGISNGRPRFDGESVRRILHRAAAEQHRLDSELADSYSLEDLEEMAAEARISPEALRAAIEAHRANPGAAAADRADGAMPDERPRGLLAALQRRMAPSGSPAGKRLVLAGAGLAAVCALLLALPVLAQALFWAAVTSLLVLSVLILLGASPF